MKTAEDIINEKKRDMVWIHADKSIYEGIQLMVSLGIGAVLIKEGDAMVGIFTERDLLRKMAAAGFNPQTARIGDHMSSPLFTAAHDTSLLKLEEIFLGRFIRHIVIEKKGVQIGMLSIGDVLRATLLEKDRQLKELHSVPTWEFYNDWGWHRKPRKP